MSEIITVRDLAMVTSDIQYAQRQGARQLASNLIEIGRLLVEAKTMVEPRDWERYIWDNFGYSTSSADNWMKLYREYGDNQESLFDSFTNSQTFGKLSYTQLLALTALPAEERSAFVESHDVENMSTRELQRAIKERDDAIRARQEAEEKAAGLEQDLAKVRGSQNQAAADAIKANDSLRKAEAAKESAQRELEQVKKQLSEAREKEKAAREDLKKARENPDIPDSVMEQMRKEAEAEAAGRVAAAVQKQLDAAEAAAREAREKLAAAQKAAKVSNPDAMSVNALGQQMLSLWNSIMGYRKKAVAADSGSAEPIHRFLTAVLKKMADELERIQNAEV